MSATKSIAAPDFAIWERVFIPDPQHISSEQARYLLALRFPHRDLDRINELSAKAADGTLKPEEEVQLENYVHIGHLLSILQAKVRGNKTDA